VSGFELLGGAAVGGDEEEVGVPQLAANGAAGGVDGRRGRSLGRERAALWILGQDGGGSERLDSGAVSTVRGFPVDLRPWRRPSAERSARTAPPLQGG